MYNMHKDNAFLQNKSPDRVPQYCKIFFRFH